MTAKRLTASLLALLMMLSGCLGDSSQDSPTEGLEATPVQDFDFLISFQFNQSLPMGYGNQTVFQTNVSDSQLSIQLMTRFHEPANWSKGSLNLTVSGPNNFWWTLSTNETLFETHIVKLSAVGNYTVVALAEGCDTEQSPIGDAFVARMNVFSYGS
jgi:hypothetical protein